MERLEMLQKPDPLTTHRQQAAWQIWVPLGMAVALVVAVGVLCALIVLGGINSPVLAQTLAPVAVIWIVIPSCFSGLITLALLVGLVFAVAKLRGGLPGLGQKLQQAVNRLQELVQSLANRLASPVIKANGLKASWDQLKAGLRPAHSPDKGG
jgi:hypothetical protein